MHNDSTPIHLSILIGIVILLSIFLIINQKHCTSTFTAKENIYKIDNEYMHHEAKKDYVFIKSSDGGLKKEYIDNYTIYTITSDEPAYMCYERQNDMIVETIKDIKLYIPENEIIN